MTADHLLPANATPLEQALSLATDPLSRLVLPADAIRQFKTDPSDPLLPWLIWEYGLGELLPYLPEPRQAIAEGILWQRLRGTPAALSTALSWIGMRATVEQEPPGVHFAEFQLDPGQVLDSDTAIANLIAIAQLSAPARSRLSRLYHGYEIVVPTGRYRLVTEPTNHLFIRVRFDFEDAATSIVREQGLFVGTQTDPQLPVGQKFFVPSQIVEPGILLVLQNSVPIVRQPSTRETFEFVVTF